MIGTIIEFLAVLILTAGAVVVLIALVAAGMLGVLAIRALRTVGRIQRWFGKLIS